MKGKGPSKGGTPTLLDLSLSQLEQSAQQHLFHPQQQKIPTQKNPPFPLLPTPLLTPTSLYDIKSTLALTSHPPLLGLPIPILIAHPEEEHLPPPSRPHARLEPPR